MGKPWKHIMNGLVGYSSSVTLVSHPAPQRILTNWARNLYLSLICSFWFCSAHDDLKIGVNSQPRRDNDYKQYQQHFSSLHHVTGLSAIRNYTHAHPAPTRPRVYQRGRGCGGHGREHPHARAGEQSLRQHQARESRLAKSRAVRPLGPGRVGGRGHQLVLGGWDHDVLHLQPHLFPDVSTPTKQLPRAELR